MSTYHEKVARIMSQSMTVGPYATYEEILAALRRQFPTEAALRAKIARGERMQRDKGAPSGWRFVPDD